LTAALAVLPEAMLVVQGDGVIRQANAPAGEVLAAAPLTLEGRNLGDFAGEDVHPFLRLCSRSRKLVPGALTVAGTAYRCEGALLEPRSGNAPALLLLRILPKEAAVNRFVALNLRIDELAREVARRQRAETALRDQRELLQVTLSSIGDAVIATDARGRVTFMNPRAEAYTGWTQAEAAGRPLDEVFVIHNEATHAEVESPVRKVLRKGAVVGLANHTVLRARDGSVRPIDDSGAPIRDAKGNMLGVVLVFRDVTERRAREHERALADRRKDEFIAMLAHELRNPLAVLDSGIEVLRLRPPTPEVTEAMGRQARQLARLVDDLLDVSRMTSGKIVIHRSPLRLDAVVGHAVESVRPVLEARQVQLSVEAPAKVMMVEADLARLSQVFGNLLANAAKFSERAGRIALVTSEEGGQAVVRVRDTGIGIAPQMLPAVFELFTQAEHSLARSHGGLGVGLTVAKQITELHGGTIEAHSEGLGKGSEFVVRLPLASRGAPERTADPAPARRSEKRRILVVDDNADAAATLAALLQLWDHEVRTAHDGKEALALVDGFQPQIVLLDLGLPGMDGFEVARRLREHPLMRGARIVAVSGYGAHADRARTREAGFHEHLTKPVSAESLETLLTAEMG
jgi:PAS domain S-box-containing protein